MHELFKLSYKSPSKETVIMGCDAFSSLVGPLVISSTHHNPTAGRLEKDESHSIQSISQLIDLLYLLGTLSNVLF